MTFVTVIHVLAAVFLILIILLQSGKGASLSGLLSGGGGEAIFASGGDIFLKKVTMVLATLFIITSLVLTVLHSRSRVVSVVQDAPVGAPTPQPAPAQQPAAEQGPVPQQPVAPVQP